MKRLPTSSCLTIRLVLMIPALLWLMESQAQAPQYSLVHATTTANIFPLASTTNQREWVFYPSDFPGAPSGMITKIYIKANTTVSPNFTNFTVMAGPTTLSTFTTGPWVTAGLSTVLFAPTWSGSTIAGNWLPIQLQSPFYYDNTSNFIVLMSQDGYSPGVSVLQGAVTARSLYGTSTSTTGTVQDRLADFGFDILPPTGAEDAGIMTITSPTSPASPGIENISVVLKNYGTDTLTSAVINWSVNGVVQTAYPWAGSLLPGGDTTSLTIGSYNFPVGAFTIKAWSSLPNGVADTINFNDTATCTIQVCNLLSGTFTVGGAAANYPTIQSAVTAVSSCGIGGPVTFNILPGTYNEQVSIPVIPGSSGLNTVTFQSSTGVASDVVIQYAAAGTADNWVVRLDGVDYITLQNLTMKTASSTGTYGRVIELINGASYNIISGNIIESMSGSTSSTTGGIYSGATNDEYNVFAFNTIRYGYYGLYIYGPSTTVRENGNIVESNILENIYYSAIYLYYQSNVMVNNNTITNSASATTVYPIRPYYCSEGTVITKNRVNMSGSSTNYGLYFGYVVGTVANQALVANNEVRQSATSSGTVYMTYFLSSSYLRFYHNSVNSISSATTYSAYFSSGNSNIEFVNNMMVNSGGAGYVMYGTTANLASLTTCNYNNYFTTGASIGYASTAVSTLAAWQQATGLDANSVSANPIFLIPAILSPSSGAVNNLGTPLALVPDDINGILRDPVTPDMGAYEFSPIATEAAHLGIMQPTGGCNLGLETVQIKIKNQGISTITTGMTASYQVAGSSSAITEPITSPILPGDTLTYNFITPVDLTVTSDSTFTIKSWITLAGDPIQMNDTSSINVSSAASPAPPQIQNAIIANGQTATLAVLNPDPSSLYYWYDVPVGGTFLAIDTNFTTPALFNTTIYYVEATGGFGSGSLLTTMVSGNGLAGCMFNLTSVNPVTIDSFYLNTGSSGTIEVYYKQGTYMGFEQNASAWTQAGTTSVVGAGVGNNTLVNIGGIQMLPGQTYGIYITFVSGTQQYTNGNGSNEFYTDGNLSLQAGAGVSYLFGTSVFTPRVFNGTVHYSSGNGCSSIRVPDTVFVQAPVLFVNIGNDTSICQGDTLQMQATVTGGVPPYTYTWSPGNTVSNPSIPNPLAFPPINTVYTVTVVDQNGDYGTDVIIITVIPPPNVIFPPLPSVFINTPPFQLTGGMPAGGTYSGPGVTNNWFHPSVAGPGGHILTYTYATPVTGCTGSDVTSIYVDPSVGIEGIGLDQGFMVFPNPGKGVINILLQTQDADVLLEVLDIQGKVMVAHRVINTTGRFELDLTALPQGVYHIRLSGDTETYLQKLILH